MELNIEVVSSVSIKRKKPWPKYAWLGEPDSSYGLFLLDNHRMSQLSLSTGKTKRKFPSLAPIQSHISLTCCSPNGAFLGGLVDNGDMFLWHKAIEVLWTFRSPLSRGRDTLMSQDVQGHKLFLSDSGEQALLVCNQREIYLWELGGGGLVPRWWTITPPSEVLLPQPTYREASIDACFFVHSVLGECCSCAFTFTNRESEEISTTNLLIQWHSPVVHFYSTAALEGVGSGVMLYRLPGEGELIRQQENDTSEGVNDRGKSQDSSKRPLKDTTNVQQSQTTDPYSFVSSHHSTTKTTEQLGTTTRTDNGCSAPFQVLWKSISCSPENGTSSDPPPFGKSCYVSKFSPAGNIMALAINRRSAADTEMLFYSPLTDSGLSSPVYQTQGDGKSGRTYWIADMAWTADGLLLVCMTRRGSLVILPRFGCPLKLVTHGCSLDTGPCYFLPVHPLITIVGATHALNITNHETSQSSERDALRQRFSVATHPHFPVLLCSDGYSITVMKLDDHLSLPDLVMGLANDSRSKLGLPTKEQKRRNENPLLPDAVESHTLGKQLVTEGFLQEDLAHDMDSTLASSPTATGPQFLTGIEAGAIHFAGVDSDLNQTLTSALGKTIQHTEQALSQLYTAWGLLMSTAKFEPGNGRYPQDRPLTDKERNLYHASYQHASSLVISTFMSLSASDRLSDVTDTAMGLVTLDSIEQSHLDLASALANAICLMLLSKCILLHKEFSKEKEPSLQSMREYSDQVTMAFSNISGYFLEVITLLSDVYDTVAPGFSIFASSSCGHTTAVSHLGSSLCSLAKITTVFWNDIRVHGNIARKIVLQKPMTNRLQMREFDLLYQNLATSIQQAAHALQFTNAHVTTSIEKLGIEMPTLAEHSSEVSLKRGPCGQHDGNPITLQLDDTVVRRLPATGLVSDNLTTLFTKLEQYDLKGAVQFAHSLITNYHLDQSSGLPISHSSSAAVATNQAIESRLHQSNNWATFHQEPTLSPHSSHTKILIESEAGLAVITCLARFMVAFFCNQHLLVSPTSSPSIPPPVFHRSSENTSRYNELDHSAVTKAVRDQGLTNYWTVDHTLELLLLCGLWEEACQFVCCLGDWKKGFLLASVYFHHNKKLNEASINLETLEDICHQLASDDILGLLAHSMTSTSKQTKAFTKHAYIPEALQPPRIEVVRSISSTLQVCALAEFDSVLITTISTIMEELTTSCKMLPVQVPTAVYLPAPPLYCPQPSIPQEDFIQCSEEWNLRGRIAVLIQNFLTLMKASNCLHPSIQWYTKKLVSLHTAVELKCFTLPKLELLQDTCPLPESFTERIHWGNSFPEQDEVHPTVQFLLAAFRQFCSLLWLLHVRDQASLWLQKMHPTAPSSANPPRDPIILKEGSLWSARLLPFSEFFSQHDNPEIEDIVLSAISELPCDTFTAELLAVCFPEACCEHNRGLDAKIKRVLSRLRAACDFESMGGSSHAEPLSMRYQTKSQTLLATRESSDIGKFHVIVPASPGQEYAMKVGEFLFEYDTEYVDFLDTLFAVTCPSPNHLSSFGQKLHSETLPYLGKYCSIVTATDTHSLSCWQQILPLLSALNEWSQESSKTQEISASGVSVQRNGTSQRYSRMDLQAAALRVNIPLPLVINCLQVKEEQAMKTTRSTSPSVVMDTSSKSLHLADLEDTILVDPSSQPKMETVVTPLTLLQVPDGILQGKLPQDAFQSLIGKKSLSRREAINPASSEISKDISLTELSTLDLEITDSASTGEIPSPITFSVGEFGSRLKANDTIMTDTLEQLPAVTAVDESQEESQQNDGEMPAGSDDGGNNAAAKHESSKEVEEGCQEDSGGEELEGGGDHGEGFEGSSDGGGGCEESGSAGGGDHGEGIEGDSADGGDHGEGVEGDGAGGGDHGEGVEGDGAGGGDHGEGGASEGGDGPGDGDSENESSKTEGNTTVSSVTETSSESKSTPNKSAPQEGDSTAPVILPLVPRPPPYPPHHLPLALRKRRRYITGASKATTNSDRLHVSRQPEVMASHKKGRPTTALESSIATAATEEEMRTLALRKQIGSLQSTTTKDDIDHHRTDISDRPSEHKHSNDEAGMHIIQREGGSPPNEPEQPPIGHGDGHHQREQRIGKIVKSEMKKILKLQHEHLLELLETTATTSESMPHVKDSEPLHIETELLGQEELNSTVITDQPTHVTILVPPIQSEGNPEPQLIATATGGTDDKRGTGDLPSNSHGVYLPPVSESHSKDMSLLDLATETTYSPGAIFPLGSSSLSVNATDGKIKPKPTRASFQTGGIFSQINQTNMCGSMPLLHVDMHAASTQNRAGNLNLQQEYPHLVKVFDSITTARQPRDDHPQPMSNMPLLTVPDLVIEPHMRDGWTKSISERSPVQQTFPKGPLPLLHFPREDTLPGMVPPLVLRWETSQPAMAQHQPSTVTPQPFPLLSLPPTTFLQPTSHPPEYSLPQVPIKPFTPKLIPPELLRQHDTGDLPLLRLEDPLSRMKQDGFELLQFPPQVKANAPQGLLHIEPHHHICQTPKPPVLFEPPVAATSECDHSFPKALDSSEEGSAVEKPTLSVPLHKKQKSKSRRRQRREKHVSWKQEKKTESVVNVRPEEITPIQRTTIGLTDALSPVPTEKLEVRRLTNSLSSVPPERLEVRRLQMNASYLQRTTSEEEEEAKLQETVTLQTVALSRVDDQATPHAEDKGTQISMEMEKYGADKSVQVELASLSLELPASAALREGSKGGRQFISVIDIEGDSDTSAASEHVQEDVAFDNEQWAIVGHTVEPSSLISEPLEQTRVQPAMECDAHTLTGEHPCPEVEPGHGNQTGAENEIEISIPATDNITKMLLMAPPQAESTFPIHTGIRKDTVPGARSKVMEHLQQLEDQLTAIENTAKTVEEEFHTSNQLLQMIDHLQAASVTPPAHVSFSDDHPTIADRPGLHTATDRPGLYTATVDVGVTPPVVTPPKSPVSSESVHSSQVGHSLVEAGVPAQIQHNEARGDNLPLPPKTTPLAAPPPPSDVPEERSIATALKDDAKRRGKGHVQFQDETKGIDLHGSTQPSPREKEDLRQWMATKRRERLGNSLRGAKGYPSKSGKDDLARLRAKRQEQKREQEKQFRAKRIQDAFSLMQDLLTSKPENLIGSQSLSWESRLKDGESTGKDKRDYPMKRTSSANMRPPRGGGKRNAKNVPGGISAAKTRSSGLEQAQSEVNRVEKLKDTHTLSSGVGLRQDRSLKGTHTLSSGVGLRQDRSLKGTHTLSSGVGLRQDCSLKGTHTLSSGVGLRQDRSLKGTHTLSSGVGLRQDRSLKDTHTLSSGVGLRQDRSLKGTHTLSSGVGLKQDHSLKGTHTLSSGVGLRQDRSLKGTHTLSSGVGLRQDRSQHTLSSTGSNKLRKISSVEGLTEDEQEQMAYILCSTDLERNGSSVSSPGSIASMIDWDEVDRIIEN